MQWIRFRCLVWSLPCQVKRQIGNSLHVLNSDLISWVCKKVPSQRHERYKSWDSRLQQTIWNLLQDITQIYLLWSYSEGIGALPFSSIVVWQITCTRDMRNILGETNKVNSMHEFCWSEDSISCWQIMDFDLFKVETIMCLMLMNILESFSSVFPNPGEKLFCASCLCLKTKNQEPILLWNGFEF